MSKIELRRQRVTDAKRFYEILSNPNFTYWVSKPDSVEDEKRFLKGNAKKAKANFEHNFAILHDKVLVGGCGLKIDQHREYIGEIGYFVDEKFWGMGIAPVAVRLLEKIGFGPMGLVRIEIRMDPRNLASERVAIKADYLKEGTLRKSFKAGNAFMDEHLYAKTK